MKDSPKWMRSRIMFAALTIVSATGCSDHQKADDDTPDGGASTESDSMANTNTGGDADTGGNTDTNTGRETDADGDTGTATPSEVSADTNPAQGDTDTEPPTAQDTDTGSEAPLDTNGDPGRTVCDYSGSISTSTGAFSCGENRYAPQDPGTSLAGDSGEVGAFAGTEDVDVTLSTIDDVLVNPGMGFADFHFGWWCNLPPVDFTPEECAARSEEHLPDRYPEPGTAYFRWLWREIEPSRGEIAFDMIDNALQSAALQGQTLGMRIIAILEGESGLPDWMTEPPFCVRGEWRDDTFFPDYRDEVFQSELRRLLRALGARYDGHPSLDHVDIGVVGCWGEWNTACFAGAESFCDIFLPDTEAEYQAVFGSFQGIIDAHLEAFPNTPVVALGGESGILNDATVYAVEHGAGWRVDCWGDWGMWGGSWSHMETLYPGMIANATAIYPGFPEIWRRSPIQLEICGTIPEWLDTYGWSADAPNGEVYRTFQWALEQHASVLNGKRTEIPEVYLPALNNLLRANGYRLVLERFNHPGRAPAGEEITVTGRWRNDGVAPMYIRRTLSYRLRGASGEAVFESNADIREWVPGSRDVTEILTLPADIPPGAYAIDVSVRSAPATLPETAPLPPIQLAMEGRRDDGWYEISQITIDSPP